MAIIKFQNAKYILSAPNKSFRPKDNLKEIVFVGKSNVGKSSLINTLTGQKIAFSSKNAGKTRYLNYFLIDSSFYLVDSPGYGFTSYGSKEDVSFGEMMEDYFQNPLLKGCIFLIDSRREPSEEDEMLLEHLKEEGVPTLLVLTKSDLAKQSDIALAKKRYVGMDVLLSSKKNKPDLLRAKIAAFLK